MCREFSYFFGPQAQQKVLEMEKGADGRDAIDAADEPNEKVMLATEHKLITDQVGIFHEGMA